MANLFDQLTFNTLRNNQLLNDQNNSGLAGYQNYDGAQEYNPNFGQSFAGIGRFDPSNMMLPSNLSQDLGASNYQDLGNSTVIDESKIPGRIQKELPTNLGIMQNFKNKLKGFTTPAMAFIKMMGGERSPEKQAAYESIMGGKSLQPWQTGQYKGQNYGLYNSPSGLKVSSDVLGWGEGYEKNFDSAFGSKSLEEMEDKKLDWAMNRVNKGRAISQRLRDVLTARGLIGGDTIDRPGKTTINNIPIGDNTSQGGGYSGPRTFSFDAGAHRRAGGNRPDKPGGFTDPGRGSYGPHRAEGGRMAEGGRIGYENGELVEEEYELPTFSERVDQEFLSDERGAIDVTDEEITLINELLGRGVTDISTISSQTGKDEGTIERVIRVLTTQSQAEGGRIGYSNGGLASIL